MAAISQRVRGMLGPGPCRAIVKGRAAWLLLLAGLLITGLVTVLVVRDQHAAQKRADQIDADDIVEAVEARMRSFVEILYGVRGLLTRAEAVTPVEFERYIASLDLAERHEGLQSLSYSPFVAHEGRAAFERGWRKSGGPYRDFDIYPPGVRPAYFPLALRVNFQGAPVRLGLDQLVSAARRAAIEQARDTGSVIGAGPVELLSPRAGTDFALSLAVYREGARTATVEERRAAFKGVVGAVFHMQELIADVTRGAMLAQRHLAIFSAAAAGAAAPRLLYDNSGKFQASDALPDELAGSVRRLQFGGSVWYVYVEPAAGGAYLASVGVPLAGSVISLLMCALVLLLTRSTATAQSLAMEMVRKLHMSEFRIARTEEFSSVMVLHAGLDGRLQKMPQSFCRLLGYREPELLALRLEDVIHPDNGARWRLQLKRLIGGDIKTADCEKRCLCKGGGTVWVALSCTMVADNDESPLHLLIYARDITAQKRAEDELTHLHAELERRVEQRTAQLQAANRELESFSYSVSHDLRAPLRHITGFVGLLARELPPDLAFSGRSHLKRINDAAARMGELIDDLLFFSRTSSAELRLAELDVAAAAQRALDELAPDLAGRNVRVTIAPLPKAPADRALLHQVWINLVSNAVKYTAPRDTAVIEIGSRPGAGDEAVFFVRDNGVGFDPAHAHRLFGVFQRLHSRDEFEGTGIGLATVQRIVHRHGGRVWAEGSIGGGATFFFALPRVAATGVPPAAVAGYGRAAA